TIFEDKKILVEKLQQNYPELTTVQVNQLKNLNYSGWGRLSERLLTHRHHHHTIIELLRSSNENFMEIITNEAYDFQGFIQSENELSSSSIRYQDVEELSTSPALKKGIWSTVKLVRELTSIFGTPEKIIIEFAKEDQIKGRRSKTLKQMWENNVKKKGLKSDEAFRDIIKEANQLSQTQFQNENIKLYLSQNGKCMYSGKKIDIHALLSKQSDKYYEVDHIIPRSFIKDDSIDNKVLVIKEMNQNKYDRVPLQFVQNPDEKIAFWKSLNKAGLISDHKLFRLMKPQFTEMDKEGFIQRQLVETRQISVHVRDFLQEEYPNSRIIPMKAKMVSEFRRRFKIPKIRELNDAHHAIDAYLNGVVYHGAQLAYPKVDLFDFNFKWEKVREKWKALGEFSTNQKSKELFFFKALEKLTVNSGKLLIEKVYNDIDHFKINYSRKRVDTEKQFYDQMPVSPKISIPKYQSDKTEFAVYQSMKVHQTHVVAMKIANKKGNIKLKYQIIDEYVIEHYKFGENNEKALALHLAQRENNNEIVAAQIVYTLYRGDLLYIEGHPCYFISSDEVINAKQFELPLSKQRELKDTIKNQNMTIEKLKEMYQFLAKQLIVEYREYLNVDGENKKSKEILGLFSQIKQTHDDYINAIGEIFKAAKASSARSEKIGSRRNGMGTRTFLGLGTDVKVGYTSITGLKTTKPKSLFKLAESNNEL
ncbi:type II CRISPR RNA-guided endonuclease Cas9, partial [Staphylococcus lutrae]